MREVKESDILVGYKALSINKGVLLSWAAHGGTRTFWFPSYKAYPPMEWVLRDLDCGPLAVFSTYPDAACFVRSMGVDLHREIWEIRYIRSMPRHRWYWNQYGKAERHHIKMSRGKDFADAVCLVKPVWCSGYGDSLPPYKLPEANAVTWSRKCI